VARRGESVRNGGRRQEWDTTGPAAAVRTPNGAPQSQARCRSAPHVCILARLRAGPFGATGSLMACSWLGHGSLRACSPTPRLSFPPAMQFLPTAEDLSRPGMGPARAGAWFI